MTQPAQDSHVNQPFDASRVERVFNATFARLQTRLTGGAQEPLYAPAIPPATLHTLYYRENFFASALHESAHWCIAGQARRQQVDFGYWYSPDGRNPQEQAAFESVEVKPQALEWFFSHACGYAFDVSLDNLGQSEGDIPDAGKFRRRVAEQAIQWQRSGLPVRANTFFQALIAEFKTGLEMSACEFPSEQR